MKPDTAAIRIKHRIGDEVIEIHHSRKVDAPSGTALALGEAAAGARGRRLEELAVYHREGLTGPRDPDAIGMQTLRGGDTVGEHTVYLVGPGERLELTHRALSRQNFAAGALHLLVGLALRRLDAAERLLVAVQAVGNARGGLANDLAALAHLAHADHVAVPAVAESAHLAGAHGHLELEADRSRMFERFWRSDEARAAPGSGLGLAIVKKIVDDHEGSVFVRSRAGGGSEIGFSLAERS